MQIHDTYYKNKHGVMLSTHVMQCIVLPDGGKMASLRLTGGAYGSDGKEILAQAEGNEYKDLTIDGSYIDSECSAFDDMFPTIDPWRSPYREYLDHGEVCRIRHSFLIESENGNTKLRTTAASPFGDYIFHKTYGEYNGTDGSGIYIEYEAENISGKPLKAIWASHMMLKAQDGMSIDIADGDYTAEFMFCDGHVSREADIRTELKRGARVPLKRGSCLLKSEPYDTNGSAYKFYIKEPYKEYFNYGDIVVKCEGADYVGIWINNGNFKSMYNVAAEFCTGAYDTPGDAEAHGADVTIPAGRSRRWKMIIFKKGEA